MEPKQKRIPHHPAATLFPMLSAERLAVLADDIRQNGLIEPIVLYRGTVIDGRNRQEACLLAGAEPKYRDWDGPGSPEAYVMSVNLHRRQLSHPQRAVIGDKLVPVFAAELKKRQATSTGGTDPQPVAHLPEAVTGRARDHAASAVEVSGRSIADVSKIRGAEPRLIRLMEANRLNVAQGMRAAKLPADDRSMVVKAMEAGMTFREAFGTVAKPRMGATRAKVQMRTILKRERALSNRERYIQPDMAGIVKEPLKGRLAALALVEAVAVIAGFHGALSCEDVSTLTDDYSHDSILDQALSKAIPYLTALLTSRKKPS